MNLEGLQIDRYILGRLLGHGGMGEVYLAEDTTIQRQVAIKVIRTEISPYPNSESAKKASDISQREMKAISKLDHPHILPLYDYGEKEINGDTLAYMVMPYREEGSLTQWLQQRNSAELLSPEDVAFFVQQAADALQHAHDNGIIHQDVKPSNFLIRNRANSPSQPDLFLADFGIAKFAAATSSTSQNVRGTPTYMAPEQWEGKPASATDQYALAVMAYELLTGQPPFQGGPAQMMYQHLNSTPEAPSTIKPDLSPYIDTVLLHALAKKPTERFPSVTSFASALQQAVQGVEPQLFKQDAETVLTPTDKQEQSPNAPGQDVQEEQRPNASDQSVEEDESTLSGSPSEDDIPTYYSPAAEDLETIISSKRPRVTPREVPYNNESTAPHPIITVPLPANLKRTAFLTLLACLVIITSSAAVFYFTKQADSSQASSAVATISAQNTATADAQGTSQAIATSAAQGNATSTALLAATGTALANAQNNMRAQQTTQAQNNINATATTQAQNDAAAQQAQNDANATAAAQQSQNDANATAAAQQAQNNANATAQAQQAQNNANATAAAQQAQNNANATATVRASVVQLQVYSAYVYASPATGTCGTSITVTYTVTFKTSASTNGGRISYTLYSNGSGANYYTDIPAGQTSTNVPFTSTVPLYVGGPGAPAVYVYTTSPNQVQSNTAQPSTTCS